LGVWSGTDFLDELGEADFGLALFIIVEQRPLRVVDVVEEVENMPAFLECEWSHGVMIGEE
jgi:hypothetical protein